MTCSVTDCGRPSRKRGWCSTHYSRWWRHGDPNTVLPNPVGAPSQIDNDGNYEPGNVRWASYSQQNANRRYLGRKIRGA